MSDDKIRLPYFKFMVLDWLSGDIQACDMRLQGIFTNIMAHVWKNGGVYNKAVAVLSQRLRVPVAELEEAIKTMKEIGLLYADEDGFLRIKFMDEQMLELAQLHEQKVLAGRKGADKRYGKQNHSTAIAPPKHTDSDTDSESDTHIKTWRNDLDTYLAECKAQYMALVDDAGFVCEQERYYPNVDIRLSLEKAYMNFWGTEAGWKHKKGKKAKDINWKLTFINAIEKNKVWKPRQGTSGSSPSLISDRIHKDKLLKRMEDEMAELRGRRWDDDAKRLYPEKWARYGVLKRKIAALKTELEAAI